MSDWTVDSLKEHIDALRADDKQALEAALVAVQQENRKSEISVEKRFDLLNELRTGVATKDQLEALEKVVNDLKDRINTSTGQNQGSQLTKAAFTTYLVAGCAFITVVVLIANKVFK
jgi:CHASE3 domain sensor protein